MNRIRIIHSSLVDKVARELSTAEKFETFTGLKPVREGSEVQ
jgi:hypothetical protein